MTLDVVSRFPIRRGAVSAVRHFPQGCGRPKFKSNPNSKHVSDVDLESKGKEFEVESGLKNNDEFEKLSCDNGIINTSGGAGELSSEKLVNGNLEELCTMEEGRDGYLKEGFFDLKRNADENAEGIFHCTKINGQNVEEEHFDSKMITDQHVGESSDSKVITAETKVAESFHLKENTDENIIEAFDSEKNTDENVDGEPLDSEKNTDENVQEAFDSKTNTAENDETICPVISTDEHAQKETDSKEKMEQNTVETTFVSERSIDENVEEPKITDESVMETFDSKKITDENVQESFDSKKITYENVKESFDSKKNTVEKVDKLNSIISIDENIVEIIDPEKFPDRNVEKSLELGKGNVKEGPSNMTRTRFVKRTGQLSVIRHFPAGCGRIVPVKNKGLSLVAEQVETSKCKAVEDEFEAGAIVKYVCDDVKNILKICVYNNEDDEKKHEYEEGNSLIGEKKQSMELEAPTSKKFKKDVEGVCTNRDVTGDLLKKKSSGGKLVLKKKSGKVVARKSAGYEATNIKRKIRDEELDDYEDDADRLFVQALKSSDDSPRRSDEKPSGIISHSAIPKPKRKRLLNSRTSFSAPQHRNNVKSSVVRQDDGNNKALTIYNGPINSCIAMNPTVSSKLILKGSGSSKNEAASRSMVKRALKIFQILARKFLQEDEKLKQNSKDKIKSRRYDLDVAKLMKSKNEFVNHGEGNVGPVPGVEVGDEFHFRTELSVVGLHRPYQAGIDYTNIKGKLIALSVVASGGYPDDVDGSDVLIYTGSGGNPSTSKTAKAEDQRLERGNLALKNCIDAQSPVRVIYGVKESTKADALDSKPKLVSTFTYDGLYMVERYWTEKGKNDFAVYKFQLRKIPNQPEISLKEVMKANKSKERVGVIANDISGGKESVRICAINTIDNERPMPFNYIKKAIYPDSYVPKPSAGCDCKNGCTDSEKCACAVKNGGSIPYNFNGAIVEAKVLVYECGPNCKCPPSCHNKVSQFGIKLPIEIFKTETRGWGVRSLASIPSGTFVCEYVGEMLDCEEAGRRDNDVYLFDIGKNYDDHSLWDGLPSYIPGAHSSDVHESVENGGFTIDAANFGNVGRFINHSCTPNLFAQSVLYDHDDKKMPHIMFFAVENIPPLKELTYHYNYKVDQVHDENGNIEKKECFCGSPECTGRLY